ncbi:MAG: hypothetical protein ACJ72N_03945 [Labedaea sp.]
MQNEDSTPAGEPAATGLMAEPATPAPPPPMPVAAATVLAQPAQAGEHHHHHHHGAHGQQPAGAGGWSVDPERLAAFAEAIERVRDRLREVQVLVDRMRSAGYTPKLGTSPVAAQLERKFADRLDAGLDNPAQPSAGGLRPMLAEAMRRMEEFVSGAETAARAYAQHDEAAAGHLGRVG